METIRDLAEEIVAREGGFVNDPDDPGGATNWGVTIGTMRANRMDMNHDGRVDVADVKALQRGQAVDLFVSRYFLQPRLDLLPEPMQPSIFDMYVNAGAGAVKILQRLLQSRGAAIADDGVIGAATIEATRREAAKVGAKALAEAYSIARRDFYYRLADQRPSSRKYVRRRDGGKAGWIIRAEHFLPESLWLSDDEHRARTAHWG